MIGLKAGSVRLLPYQACWTVLFAAERERLQSAVGSYVIDIQHVGSTSIPGLAAKPIIDIAIAVENFEEAAACIPPIEELGYTYLGENGIPRRHYFQQGDPRTHHIHMNEIGSRDWENQILFREYLIHHPEAAREYEALKIRLSRQYPADAERYTLEKAPFIERILDLARGGINDKR